MRARPAHGSSRPALFNIEDAGRAEMIGQVAEQDLAGLKVGQEADVYMIGYTRPFQGRIWLLGATIDPQSRLGEVRIALSPNAALRPGAFARGSVTVAQAKRPVLPQTAVMSDASGSYVYVAGPEGKVERRAVRVGNATPDGVVIEEGLTGKERIVAIDGGFLHSGQKVRAAPEQASNS
ncbi:MAG: efflux RND transporter periplasmic adaptor subunit [Solirubrobacteraceae bacterium]